MTSILAWLLNGVYLVALIAALPWIVWSSVAKGKYRAGFGEKLLGAVPRRTGLGPCIWIHAVSVGEVNLISTVVRELQRTRPDWEIVVSTTSKAGHDLAQVKFRGLTVFYCPVDFSWAVSRAMRRVRPTLLLLAELELWPNLIFVAKRNGAKVAIINGRLSDKSFPRYRRIRPFVSRVVAAVDLVAAQNQGSAERFRQIGARHESVVVTGSIKYDGAITDRNNPRTEALRRIAALTDDDLVFLAGSTQEPEEEIALEVYERLAPEFSQLRLILVPRHPERFDSVASLLAARGADWVRRSALSGEEAQGIGTGKEPARAAAIEPDISPNSIQSRKRPIILVDSVGELGAWWGTAKIAFVGGSLGSRGGQNMIEPAGYGAAVSFGPNTRNFRDIVAALSAAQAAVVVQDAAELERFVRRCLADPAFATSLGQRARAHVESQQGALHRTARTLDVLMEPGPPNYSRLVGVLRTAA